MRIFCKHEYRLVLEELFDAGRSKAYWFRCKKCGKAKCFFAGTKRLQKFIERQEGKK